MGGRIHLLSEDSNGKVKKIKVDPANLDKQMREEKARGRKPYVVDDDELIKFGTMLKK